MHRKRKHRRIPDCWNGGKTSGIAVLLAFILTQPWWEAVAVETEVIDAFTCSEPVAGMALKESEGGMFTERGWVSTSETGMLKIELDGEGLKEGILEVEVSSDDWEGATRKSGKNRKLHFINMFSNGLGEHHAEDGGEKMDALWTLRHGTSEDGSFRYGNGFKVLWASKGAKRSPGSDYHEKNLSFPNGILWEGKLAFRIYWSAKLKSLKIHVNEVPLADLQWQDQQAPLKYIFLGKAGDFHSLQGVYFSNLRISKLW